MDGWAVPLLGLQLLGRGEEEEENRESRRWLRVDHRLT